MPDQKQDMVNKLLNKAQSSGGEGVNRRNKGGSKETKRQLTSLPPQSSDATRW